METRRKTSHKSTKSTSCYGSGLSTKHALKINGLSHKLPFRGFLTLISMGGGGGIMPSYSVPQYLRNDLR